MGSRGLRAAVARRQRRRRLLLLLLLLRCAHPPAASSPHPPTRHRNRSQIGLDDKSPDLALFQCYYRWAKLPVMEITFLLEKRVAEPGRRIEFSSDWGMPMKGALQLTEEGGGSTRVRLEFTHPVPNLLVQLKIGPLGIENHMQQILTENLEDFKTLVEGGGGGGGGAGSKPPGALRQRTEAAKREQEQRPAGPSGRSGDAAAGGEAKPRRGRPSTLSRGAAGSPAPGGGEAGGAAVPPRKRGRPSRRSTAGLEDGGKGSRPPSRE
jgi:hypothetical protein